MNYAPEEAHAFRRAERIVVTPECIGDGRWRLQKGGRRCERAHRLRPADRTEPGHPISARARLCRTASGRHDLPPRSGRVTPIDSMAPLSEADIGEASHLVGQMGTEAFCRALQADADVTTDQPDQRFLCSLDGDAPTGCYGASDRALRTTSRVHRWPHVAASETRDVPRVHVLPCGPMAVLRWAHGG